MTGRPPRAGEAAPQRTIRATNAEWTLWKKAARASDKNVSEWLRELANKESAWIPGAEALARKHRRSKR